MGIIGLSGMAGLMGMDPLGKLNSPVKHLHFHILGGKMLALEMA